MKTLLSKIPAFLYYLVAAGSLLGGIFFFYRNLSNPGENHLEMELASALVFVGMVCAWCARDYERSAALRFFVMVFFGLIALVHWLDYFRGNLTISSPMYNSLPLLGLTAAEIIICNLRKANEAGA
jgi:hypothetical protein